MSIIVKLEDKDTHYYGCEIVDIFDNMMSLASDNYFNVLNGDRRLMLNRFYKIISKYIDTNDNNILETDDDSDEIIKGEDYYYD